MGSFVRAWVVLFVVTSAGVCLFAVWFAQKLDSERQAPCWAHEDGIERRYDSYSALKQMGLPVCRRPFVIRGMFKFESDKTQGACRHTHDDDECVTMISERMVDMFGDRTVQAFPPTHVSYSKASNDSVLTTLGDFLTKDKYERWVVNTLQQLGSTEEYDAFLNLSQSSPSFFETISTLPNGRYLGSQCMRSVHTRITFM